MPDAHANHEKISIREAAAILQRSTKSIRNYVKAGRLAAEKVPGPKGPQFVFRAREVAALAKELRLDAEHLGVDSRGVVAAEHGNLPAQVPGSLHELVEAFLVSERERVKLLQELADARAETGHTIGVLEERVTQLQHRLKREEKIAEKSHDLEKELRAWKKKTELRDEQLRRYEELREALERRHWWQFWRPQLDDRLDGE